MTETIKKNIGSLNPNLGFSAVYQKTEVRVDTENIDYIIRAGVSAVVAGANRGIAGNQLEIYYTNTNTHIAQLASLPIHIGASICAIVGGVGGGMIGGIDGIIIGGTLGSTAFINLKAHYRNANELAYISSLSVHQETGVEKNAEIISLFVAANAEIIATFVGASVGMVVCYKVGGEDGIIIGGLLGSSAFTALKIYYGIAKIGMDAILEYINTSPVYQESEVKDYTKIIDTLIGAAVGAGLTGIIMRAASIEYDIMTYGPVVVPGGMLGAVAGPQLRGYPMNNEFEYVISFLSLIGAEIGTFILDNSGRANFVESSWAALIGGLIGSTAGVHLQLYFHTITNELAYATVALPVHIGSSIGAILGVISSIICGATDKIYISGAFAIGEVIGRIGGIYYRDVINKSTTDTVEYTESLPVSQEADVVGETVEYTDL